MLRNIYLYGELEKSFGKVWRLDVESVCEAAHAIDVNTGGKFRRLTKGMKVQVIRGKDLNHGEILDEQLIKLNYRSGDFHITPVAEGASGPWILVGILAASLIAGAIVAFTMPGVRPEDNFESDERGYSFGAPQDSGVQGFPIPLVYGEVYTSGVPISQGIKIEEVV